MEAMGNKIFAGVFISASKHRRPCIGPTPLLRRLHFLLLTSQSCAPNRLSCYIIFVDFRRLWEGCPISAPPPLQSHLQRHTRHTRLRTKGICHGTHSVPATLTYGLRHLLFLRPVLLILLFSSSSGRLEPSRYVAQHGQ